MNTLVMILTMPAIWLYFAYSDRQSRLEKAENNRHKEAMAKLKLIGDGVSPAKAVRLKSRYGENNYNYVIQQLIESGLDDELVFENQEQQAIYGAICDGDEDVVRRLREG
jgi:hypothetical protein